MRRRLNISVASGDDSFPLEPPVVIPRSLPADCSPESEALELSSAADSAWAWLSMAGARKLPIRWAWSPLDRLTVLGTSTRLPLDAAACARGARARAWRRHRRLRAW